MISIFLQVSRASIKRVSNFDRETEANPQWKLAKAPTELTVAWFDPWNIDRHPCALTRATSTIFGIYDLLLPTRYVCVSCPGGLWGRLEKTLVWSAKPKQTSFYFRQGNWVKLQDGFLIWWVCKSWVRGVLCSFDMSESQSCNFACTVVCCAFSRKTIWAIRKGKSS